MKKLALLLVAFMLMFTLIPGKESQAKLKDGTYKVNYTGIMQKGIQYLMGMIIL